jgi:hypothetical protein
MTDFFRFIGEDGSLGYRTGKIYLLTIRSRDNTPEIVRGLFTRLVCPYWSW